MKKRMITLSLALCFAAMFVVLAQAADFGSGSWKLNEAKSKFTPGSPQSTMVVYAPSGDSVKVTIDGTGADGKPSHTEWTGKFDGKDYPVTGDSNQSTRSYTKVDANTMKFKVKSGDKVVLSGTIAIAPDGMTRTVTASGTGASGKKFSYSSFYDKQ